MRSALDVSQRLLYCFVVLPAPRTPTGRTVESFGGGFKSFAASTKGRNTGERVGQFIFRLSLSQILLYLLKSCHFQSPISIVKGVRQLIDRFLQPKVGKGTCRLTTVDDDALATSGFLLESERVGFSHVTYVDPGRTRLGKEIVTCRVGLDTVSNVVVEQRCSGIERGGGGGLVHGWLSRGKG